MKMMTQGVHSHMDPCGSPGMRGTLMGNGILNEFSEQESAACESSSQGVIGMEPAVSDPRPGGSVHQLERPMHLNLLLGPIAARVTHTRTSAYVPVITHKSGYVPVISI